MLPVQLGAMTLDGTWLILLGIIAVAGIVYKNRNNISLASTNSNINENTNVNANMQAKQYVESSTTMDKTIIKDLNKDNVNESVEVLNQEVEMEEVIN